jgi:hypothetical protein
LLRFAGSCCPPFADKPSVTGAGTPHSRPRRRWQLTRNPLAARRLAVRWTPKPACDQNRSTRARPRAPGLAGG